MKINLIVAICVLAFSACADRHPSVTVPYPVDCEQLGCEADQQCIDGVCMAIQLVQCPDINCPDDSVCEDGVCVRNTETVLRCPEAPCAPKYTCGDDGIYYLTETPHEFGPAIQF